MSGRAFPSGISKGSLGKKLWPLLWVHLSPWVLFKIFLCFSAKQVRFYFKQHLHKPSLICALEKCIFEPKHHLVCEITKGQSCFSACVWIWVQQTQQLNAVPLYPGTHTGAVWALTPMDELRNEPPVLLDTHSQMQL